MCNNNELLIETKCEFEKKNGAVQEEISVGKC